jgi:hypothetical protein
MVGDLIQAPCAGFTGNRSRHSRRGGDEISASGSLRHYAQAKKSEYNGFFFLTLGRKSAKKNARKLRQKDGEAERIQEFAFWQTAITKPIISIG